MSQLYTCQKRPPYTTVITRLYQPQNYSPRHGTARQRISQDGRHGRPVLPEVIVYMGSGIAKDIGS